MLKRVIFGILIGLLFLSNSYSVAFSEFIGKYDYIYSKITYQDPKTGITFYVEGDGRHVVAVNKVGTVLWRRDPFEDAHLPPYRVDRPVIRDIGGITQPFIDCCAKGIKKNYVVISYDSTQYGMIDEYSGDFILLGEN